MLVGKVVRGALWFCAVVFGWVVATAMSAAVVTVEQKWLAFFALVMLVVIMFVLAVITPDE